MDNALLPSETSGSTRLLRQLGFAVLVILTLTVTIVGIVKGLEAGKHSFIFVAIMLQPLLVGTVMQLRWTDGDAIDERLTRLAYASAVFLVGLDISLLVAMMEKIPSCPTCAVCPTCPTCPVCPSSPTASPFY